MLRPLVFPLLMGKRYSTFIYCFSIIEIGAIELVNGQRTGILFQSYANTTANIHYLAYEAHGISNEFLTQVISSRTTVTDFISTRPLKKS